MVIYTEVGGRMVKRGSLDNGFFRRDNCPYVWNSFISLEPNVLEQLEQKGCMKMVFSMRDGKIISTDPKSFRLGSVSREMGMPDKRLQFLYNTNQPKKNEKQLEML